MPVVFLNSSFVHVSFSVVMQEEESAHTDDLASYDWDGERDLIDISSAEVNEILASVRYFGSQKRMLTRMNM